MRHLRRQLARQLRRLAARLDPSERTGLQIVGEKGKDLILPMTASTGGKAKITWTTP